MDEEVENRSIDDMVNCKTNDDEFMMELFDFVINDRENMLALKRFAVKDFNIEIPLFYIKWRELMTSILIESINLPDSNIEIKDSLTPSAYVFQWRTSPSSPFSFFPDQIVPEKFIEKFEDFFQRFINPDSLLAINISSFAREKIIKTFETHFEHITKSKNEPQDQMSMNNPAQQVFGVWGPLFIVANPSESVPNKSPLDGSPAVVSLATVTAVAAERVGAGPSIEKKKKSISEKDEILEFHVEKSGDLEVIAVARVPKKKTLKLSVFSEVKNVVLKTMFESMFVRFLESEDGKEVVEEEVQLLDSLSTELKRITDEVQPKTANDEKVIFQANSDEYPFVLGINNVTTMLQESIQQKKDMLVAVIVCNGDIPIPHMYEHFPAMVALAGGEVRIHGFAKGAEAAFSAALRKRRVSVIGIKKVRFQNRGWMANSTFSQTKRLNPALLETVLLKMQRPKMPVLSSGHYAATSPWNGHKHVASHSAAAASDQAAARGCALLNLLPRNALDAHAASIDIKLSNGGLNQLSVKDSGTGVECDQVENMCKRYYTSKITDFAELSSLRSLGFRGEGSYLHIVLEFYKITLATALNSIVSVSESVQIVTRTSKENVGRSYDFDKDGNVLKYFMLFTWIFCVKQLFVLIFAQGRLQSPPRFALLYPSVRFSLKLNADQKDKKPRLGEVDALEKPAVESTMDAIKHIFGKSISLGLQNVSLNVPLLADDSDEEFPSNSMQFKIEAIIPKLISDPLVMFRTGTERVFINISNRPVSSISEKFVKTIITMIREKCAQVIPSAPTSKKNPFIWLHIIISPDRIDVNVEPNKTTVLVHDSDVVISGIEKVLELAYPSLSAVVPESTQGLSSENEFINVSDELEIESGMEYFSKEILDMDDMDIDFPEIQRLSDANSLPQSFEEVESAHKDQNSSKLLHRMFDNEPVQRNLNAWSGGHISQSMDLTADEIPVVQVTTNSDRNNIFKEVQTVNITNESPYIMRQNNRLASSDKDQSQAVNRANESPKKVSQKNRSVHCDEFQPTLEMFISENNSTHEFEWDSPVSKISRAQSNAVTTSPKNVSSKVTNQQPTIQKLLSQPHSDVTSRKFTPIPNEPSKTRKVNTRIEALETIRRKIDKIPDSLRSLVSESVVVDSNAGFMSLDAINAQYKRKRNDLSEWFEIIDWDEDRASKKSLRTNMYAKRKHDHIGVDAIGVVESESGKKAWVVRKKSKIMVLKLEKVQESVLFTTLMDAFKLTVSKLQKPLTVSQRFPKIGINAMESAKCIVANQGVELTSTSVDQTRFRITDARIEHNGFEVFLCNDHKTGYTTLEILGVATQVPNSDAQQDLRELLILIHTMSQRTEWNYKKQYDGYQGEHETNGSLFQFRIPKVANYFKNQAKLLACKKVDEIIALFGDLETRKESFGLVELAIARFFTVLGLNGLDNAREHVWTCPHQNQLGMIVYDLENYGS
ncbi:ATP-binding mismatch repair protein [Nowakowskiella sp. JEL0078]|nr:ATP-binding mismatch repair protein [Nowakowskiella sp. JEL0078]